MSSVYETEKLYLQMPATAPPDDTTYRLKKIEEAENFLREEMKERGNLTKQFKRRAKISEVFNHATTVLMGGVGTATIVTSATVVGLPVGVILGVVSVIFGFGAATSHATQKLFSSKTKKNDKIKTLAESKLDTISSLVSKAIEDAHVSHQEYALILKEVEHYRTMKEEIRTKSKKTTDAITAEQREAILAQGRKEGQQAFLAKIAASSGIQPVSAT